MFSNFFRNYRFRDYNFRLLISVVALTVIGIFVIASANPDFFSKQLLGLGLGLLVMLVISLVDYDFLLNFSRIYYLLTCLSLLAVFFFGKTTGGATRWIRLKGFQFQPSELAKVLLVLYFAKYLSDHTEDINEGRRLFITCLLAAVPLILIVREPDLSTTIVTFLIIVSMLFIAGLSRKIVATALGVTVPAISLLIFFIYWRGPALAAKAGYQLKRILAWLRPNEFPESSYQQQNSIMAIASGIFWGKGINNTDVDSVKNGNYISEPQTDFIFAVAGEELGFVGSLVIVGLLFFIVYLCFQTGSKAKTLSGKLICVGIGSLIGFQSFVNICVVSGLMPNTGLPLPFVSYGLTSLVTLYFGIGLVLNVGLQSGRRRGGLRF